MRVIPRATATAVAVAILTVACVPPPPSDQAARDLAGQWLITQFDPATALIPSPFVPGQPDLAATTYAVTSLRIAGYGASTASAAVAASAPIFDPLVKDGSGNDLPGSLARLILAVESVGGDARSFGGFDLVARLEATMATSGPDAGRFGVQDATYDGAFRQGLALSALSVVEPIPASIDPGAGPVEALPAVAWLRSQQCADGSWMPYRSDLAQPCGFDPSTFAGPDTNSTAMATIGLAALGAGAPQDALGWLSSIRNADGGWSFDGGTGSITDPDSTGLVMAAHRARGVAPDTAAIEALRRFQFDWGVDPAARGAFYYPFGTPTPNLLATNDAVLGLSPTAWPGVLIG